LNGSVKDTHFILDILTHRCCQWSWCVDSDEACTSQQQLQSTKNIKSKSEHWFQLSCLYYDIFTPSPIHNNKRRTNHPYPTGSADGFGLQFGHQGSSIMRRHCSNNVHKPWLCRETVFGWCLRLDSI